MDNPWQLCRTIGQRFPLASAKAQPGGGGLLREKTIGVTVLADRQNHTSIVICRYMCRVREIRGTRRTCPAEFENVRRRAIVKSNQMSGEKLEMSGEAQNNFAYSDMCNLWKTVMQSVRDY